jgi:hypothetical protein
LRTLVTFVAAITLVGSSAGATLGINSQRVEKLLEGIFQDVGAILQSFEGGPDDPKNPVTNRATLQQDSQRLDAATRKANDLADQLNKLHH